MPPVGLQPMPTPMLLRCNKH